MAGGRDGGRVLVGAELSILELFCDMKWFFFSFFSSEIFFGGGRLQGWWMDMEGLRNE